MSSLNFRRFACSEHPTLTLVDLPLKGRREETVGLVENKVPAQQYERSQQWHEEMSKVPQERPAVKAPRAEEKPQKQRRIRGHPRLRRSRVGGRSRPRTHNKKITTANTTPPQGLQIRYLWTPCETQAHAHTHAYLTQSAVDRHLPSDSSRSCAKVKPALYVQQPFPFMGITTRMQPAAPFSVRLTKRRR